MYRFLKRTPKSLAVVISLLLVGILASEAWSMFRVRVYYKALDHVLHVTQNGVETTVETPFSPNGVIEVAKDTYGDGNIDTWIVEAHRNSPRALYYRATDENADGEPDDLRVEARAGLITFEHTGKHSAGEEEFLKVVIGGSGNSIKTTEYIDLNMDGMLDVRKQVSPDESPRIALALLQQQFWQPVDSFEKGPEGYIARWMNSDETAVFARFEDGRWLPYAN